MSKILMISDLHFGCRSNSDIYIDISYKYLTEDLAKVIVDNNITDVRILGDVLDNRNAINVKTMNIVLDMFKYYLVNHPTVHFKIIIGNHDIYYHNRIDINSLNMLKEFSNVTVIDTVQIETIDNKTIVSVPWISSPSSSIYSDFFDMVGKNTKYDYLMGHFEIRGFELSPGIKDEHGIKQDSFNNFGSVYSGHYHIRATRGNITYLGCPYEMTWSDYGNVKGCHILDVSTGDIEFIENKSSPRHYVLKVSDLSSDKQANINLIKKCKDNFVKLVIDVKKKDTVIIKLIHKIESLNPLRLDIDNQVIDVQEVDDSVDLGQYSDPLVFLLEYAKLVDIEEDLTQPELLKTVQNIYSLSLKDR